MYKQKMMTNKQTNKQSDEQKQMGKPTKNFLARNCYSGFSSFSPLEWCH